MRRERMRGERSPSARDMLEPSIRASPPPHQSPFRRDIPNVVTWQAVGSLELPTFRDGIPRRVRGLRREGSRPGVKLRRRGGHGQPVEPQGAKRASADRGRRSDAALPAALQSRLQPDRECLRQTKALLRKAAERTIDGLRAAIGRLIDTFTPSECANYFTAAGYDAT